MKVLVFLAAVLASAHAAYVEGTDTKARNLNPYHPHPVPKPVAKPAHHGQPWPGPCYKTYETEFHDQNGLTRFNEDNMAMAAADVVYPFGFFFPFPGGPARTSLTAVLGDYFVLSGDLWARKATHIVGFFEAMKFTMEPINGDVTKLVFGTIQLYNFGQMTFTGIERDFNDVSDGDNKKGPVQDLAITGGVDAFLGAGGTIQAVHNRATEGDALDDFITFTLKPKCPIYPAPQPHPWP